MEPMTDLLRDKGLCGAISSTTDEAGTRDVACVLEIGHDEGIHEPAVQTLFESVGSAEDERGAVLVHLRNAAEVWRNRANEQTDRGVGLDMSKRAAELGRLANEIERGVHRVGKRENWRLVRASDLVRLRRCFAIVRKLVEAVERSETGEGTLAFWSKEFQRAIGERGS